MVDAERQLDGFIEKFAQEDQQLIRALRAAMQRRLPRANELIWDNYNFFVIGYCTTERPSDAILSIAAAANGAVLSFYHGADLADPTGILLGEGAQNRFIRLPSPDELADPAVDALIAQAESLAAHPYPADTGPPKLIIRSVSAKQRPRRREAKAGPIDS